MPLKIEMTSDRAAPIIVCDHCGEPITDAREGNYQWLAEAEGDTVRRFLFFTHKWCCHDFEQARGGAATWYAMELVDLLPYLAASLKLDRAHAQSRADPTSRFG